MAHRSWGYKAVDLEWLFLQRSGHVNWTQQNTYPRRHLFTYSWKSGDQKVMAVTFDYMPHLQAFGAIWAFSAQHLDLENKFVYLPPTLCRKLYLHS